MNTALITCATPSDQDVVKAMLGAIFAAAGTTFAEKKLEDRLAAQDMCDVAMLEQLTVGALIAHFGMTYGEALAVDGSIFPKAAQVPVVAAVMPLGAAPGQISGASGSRTASEFPALGTDGLPSTRDLRGWLPGFRTHLAGRISAIAMAEYDALIENAKHPIPPVFSTGVTADGEALMTALLTAGSKGLPPGLVLSFPKVAVTNRQGLVALKHLLARVFTVTDSGLGVLLAWFQKPELVVHAWLLGLALTKWLEVREQLEADGLPQSDIACRLSLCLLCSKLADLKAVFAALKVAHPNGIPIQVLIDSVRSEADSYSSLRSTSSEVSVLAEGYTLVAHHEKSGGPGLHHALFLKF